MIKKSIVIDFDHTIGYFNQIIFLINIVEKTYNITLNNKQIYSLLENYPLVFRPKLYEIFLLILLNKHYDKITLFILYTCNKRPQFVESIVDYLTSKLKSYLPSNITDVILFQYIVYEPTKKKNIEYLSSYLCNDIKENNHAFCFIDNKLYKYTNHHIIIKYIKSASYVYNYDIKDIIRLFPYSIFDKITSKKIQKFFKYKTYQVKPSLSYSIYEINSSFILQSIRDFVSNEP